MLFSCADTKPGDGQEQGSTVTSNAPDSGATTQLLPDSRQTETPSGRTQLPTFRTAAPDLWITLPEGFTVRVDTMFSYDIMVVASNDDPLLRDSTQIPLGMLRVTISDSTIRLPLPGKQAPERNVVLGALDNYLGLWRSSTVALPDGTTYSSYEMAANDFFARIYQDREIKDLRLHLYIGGKDSVKTAQLLKAVESISIKP